MYFLSPLLATWPTHRCLFAFNTLRILRDLYERVSKSSRTESITKYTLTTINTRWEATQRVMAAKLTRMTHKIAIQLHLVAEICTICSSRSRRPVRKLLDTPSYWEKSCSSLIRLLPADGGFRRYAGHGVRCFPFTCVYVRIITIICGWRHGDF
jgi:hypothetical protein